jgi:ubiquitin carboxyl-terminal hydrolase 34
VLVQQDASEFVIQFLQQLEGKVMGSSSEAMLRESFGGVFCNELLAEGGRRSEQPEVFSYISVVVKDQHSLEAALTKVVAGEVVDYKWEDPAGGDAPAQQLPTLKRTSVRELPRHLIIHLKRFDFDFNLMQQVKINDRYTHTQ